MTRQSFPEIPLEALRSHAEPARVERVWRRLELDVARSPRPRRSMYWLAPAMAAGIFGLGVLVGARLYAPALEVAAVAEPRPALPTPGAGRAAPAPAPAAEHKQAPLPKQARSHAPVADPVALEEYPATYGEPVAAPLSEPAPVVVGPAEWEKLAESGDFQGAKAAIDADGGFIPAIGRASASQLLVLADVARASGSREQAMLALRRVLTAYVSAPEAPIAAWTLGNLLDQSGDRVGAADAYATYRRLSPTGDFAEDAAARQVDVAFSQGNLELAGRAVDEYAQNFPKGRRLAEFKKRLLALAAPAAEASSAVSEPEEDDEATEPGAETPAAAPVPAPLREH